MCYKSDTDDEIKTLSVPAYDFRSFEGLDLVDTTGAGDAFTGAFAVGLLEGNANDYESSAKAAMTLGCQTAFLTISRYGAGPAMPQREEINGMKF